MYRNLEISRISEYPVSKIVIATSKVETRVDGISKSGRHYYLQTLKLEREVLKNLQINWKYTEQKKKGIILVI